MDLELIENSISSMSEEDVLDALAVVIKNIQESEIVGFRYVDKTAEEYHNRMCRVYDKLIEKLDSFRKN